MLRKMALFVLRPGIVALYKPWALVFLNQGLFLEAGGEMGAFLQGRGIGCQAQECGIGCTKFVSLLLCLCGKLSLSVQAAVTKYMRLGIY